MDESRYSDSASRNDAGSGTCSAAARRAMVSAGGGRAVIVLKGRRRRLRLQECLCDRGADIRVDARISPGSELFTYEILAATSSRFLRGERTALAHISVDPARGDSLQFSVAWLNA